MNRKNTLKKNSIKIDACAFIRHLYLVVFLLCFYPLTLLATLRDGVFLGELNQIFEYLRNRSDIAFRVPEEGCFVRSKKMCFLLEKEFRLMSKQILAVSPYLETRTIWNYTGKVEWQKHIAPIVSVIDESEEKKYVVDPSVGNAPLKKSKWLSTISLRPLMELPPSFYSTSENEYYSLFPRFGVNGESHWGEATFEGRHSDRIQWLENFRKKNSDYVENAMGAFVDRATLEVLIHAAMKSAGIRQIEFGVIPLHLPLEGEEANMTAWQKVADAMISKGCSLQDALLEGLKNPDWKVQLVSFHSLQGLGNFPQQISINYSLSAMEGENIFLKEAVAPYIPSIFKKASFLEKKRMIAAYADAITKETNHWELLPYSREIRETLQAANKENGMGSEGCNVIGRVEDLAKFSPVSRN